MMRFLTLMLCVTAVTAAPAMAQGGSVAAGYDETGVLNQVTQTGTLPPVVPPTSGELPTQGKNPTTGDLPTGDALPTADVGTEDEVTPAGSTPAKPRTVEAGANAPASLPFTGLDVGIILAAGLALLATGMVLRRSARSNA